MSKRLDQCPGTDVARHIVGLQWLKSEMVGWLYPPIVQKEIDELVDLPQVKEVTIDQWKMLRMWEYQRKSQLQRNI